MFRLSVLQNQWLILALFGGVILMIGLVSAYLMMWRPRIDSLEPVSGGRALTRWIPWILYALLIIIVIYQITYAIILHFYPPNI
jgi:hypothetical protein